MPETTRAAFMLVFAGVAVFVAFAVGRRSGLTEHDRAAAAASASAAAAAGSAAAGAGSGSGSSAAASASNGASQRGLPAPMFTVSALPIGASAPPRFEDGGMIGSPASPNPAALASARARFLAETSTLAAARTALDKKDGAKAMTLLDQHDRDYPDGILGPDARVMRIEALALSGRRDEALSRADAFLADYPHSPEAARVRDLADDLRAKK